MQADDDINDVPCSDLKSELMKAIKSSRQQPAPEETRLPKCSNSDFKCLEMQMARSECLEKVYKALLTVKPTSVEAERAFSTSGSFVTKIRSRMSDACLSALVSLKCCFKK